MTRRSGVTILVTGGAGFLGQHIVKELMEQELFPVREIRTFDIQPFTWNENFPRPSKDFDKLFHIQGSICDLDEITKACEGADAVIHTCSAIAYGPFPNKRAMHAVNVKGTENTLAACEMNNVECLVYTSTMEVANDFSNPGVDQTEETAHVPAVTPVFPTYALTKYTAEKLVLDAHRKELSNRKWLLTCSLRPCGIYGEGERIITENLAAFMKSGVGFRLGEPEGKSQYAYAGNIAYSHVLAVKALLWPEGGDTRVGGRAFFLGDDTPVTSIGSFLEPFIDSMGVNMSQITVPYWLMYSIALILTTLCWFISPFTNAQMPFHTASVKYMYGQFSYSWDGFRDATGFRPRYSYEDGLKRSVNYCRKYFGLKDKSSKEGKKKAK